MSAPADAWAEPRRDHCAVVGAERHAHLILRLRHNAPMGLRRARSLLLLGVGVNVLCVRTVCAGLGGNSASIIADSIEMQGSVHAYSSPQFEIQEITTENGICVREFVN